MNKLYYISQGETPDEHLQNIERVCKAGVKWIQLRLKNVEPIVYLHTAIKCRELCDAHEAILIINDSIMVAKASQADGVHLGLGDQNPKEAREILGNNAIIGGTANTYKDCLTQIKAGVDYLGIGPFKYTTTKEKLSPILGIDGYHELFLNLKNNDVEIPIYAIGGITIEDIPELMMTGVTGIAASSMLTNPQNLDAIVAQVV